MVKGRMDRTYRQPRRPVKAERPAAAAISLEAVARTPHSKPVLGRLDARMTQSNNRFLDELAKLMTDAAGAAQGMRREVETLMRTQGERLLRDLDVVQREEFEAVKEMAAKAREENERLAARIAELESEIANLRKPA
jgi:BMFP domain-containing protein YqiC